MLFIVSKDIDPKALRKLEKRGNVVLFDSSGLAYKGIDKHPDVFFAQINNKTLIAAPNTPIGVLKQIEAEGYTIVLGQNPIVSAYPYTAFYNALITSHFIIHNKKITDPVILSHCTDKKYIHVSQAYVRCNAYALKDKTFCVSDRGIYKTLITNKVETLFIDPSQIILRGFKYGFFGGCCGGNHMLLFVNGSLSKLKEASALYQAVDENKLELIELSNNKPEDIGGVLVLDDLKLCTN